MARATKAENERKLITFWSCPVCLEGDEFVTTDDETGDEIRYQVHVEHLAASPACKQRRLSIRTIDWTPSAYVEQRNPAPSGPQASEAKRR